MNAPKIVIDTDLLVDHLRCERAPSVLRVAMGEFLCYTTVFNAVELFALARNARERGVMEDALGGMKILGLNAKNAPQIGEILKVSRNRDLNAALIGGLCRESRLGLLTGRPGAYRGIKGLLVIPSRTIRPGRSAGEILDLRTR